MASRPFLLAGGSRSSYRPGHEAPILLFRSSPRGRSSPRRALPLPAQPALRSRRAAAAPAASSGIDLAGIDRSVAPGDDFFACANGSWMKTTEIPADRSSWGSGGDPDRADGEADGRADRRGGDGRTRPPAPRPGRSATPTRRFLDEAAIEAKGLAPLKPALERDRRDRGHAGRSPAPSAATLRADVDALNNTNFYTANVFGLWVAQDLDEPTRYAPFLLQGGLGHARPRLLPRPVAAHGRDPGAATRSTSRRC